MKNIGTITIRKVRLRDAAKLAALSGELGYPTSPSEMERRLKAIHSDRRHAVFIAERGQVIGWIHVAAIESLESELIAEIRGLVVTASFRGEGVGTRLAAAAEEWAARLQYPRIRVRTNVLRTGTHAFYKKLGFASAKTQCVFDKTLGQSD